jgi:small subunit ribosomal protein S6
LRPYETMLLLDARRDDAEIEQTINSFTALVTERGGEIANVDKWGRRKLAYEIEDHTDGFYAVFTYSIEPSHRAEIEAALPFVEGLVRAKTVRRDIRTRGT